MFSVKTLHLPTSGMILTFFLDDSLKFTGTLETSASKFEIKRNYVLPPPLCTNVSYIPSCDNVRKTEPSFVQDK